MKAKYFEIYELVDPEVFNKYGKTAWRFFDPRLIECLDFVREHLGKVTVNTWKWGGQFSQRGLRTNISPLVKSKSGLYLSAHCLGMAADFDVEGLTASQVRNWLQHNKPPHNIRLEDGVNWVHLDTATTIEGVFLFKP